MSVHHVSFLVDDVPAAVIFYRDVLGCSEIPRPDFGFPGAWLEIGTTQVHLAERGKDVPRYAPAKPTPDPALINHIAFGVHDLDATVSALEAGGYEVRRGTVVAQAFVLDPSGNLIELAPLRPASAAPATA